MPAIPKLATVSVRYDDFEKWYLERAAADAKKKTRSSREQDRDAARIHFGCDIPREWIREIRDTLPEDHPYRTKGRRRAS